MNKHNQTSVCEWSRTLIMHSLCARVQHKPRNIGRAVTSSCWDEARTVVCPSKSIMGNGVSLLFFDFLKRCWNTDTNFFNNYNILVCDKWSRLLKWKICVLYSYFMYLCCSASPATTVALFANTLGDTSCCSHGCSARGRIKKLIPERLMRHYIF